MLIPASQGDIFQTPSWFSLICTTSYGPGNVRCTASTHVSAVHGLVIPEASPVRRNDKRGRSPGRHHFFPALSSFQCKALCLPRTIVCLQLWQAPFPCRRRASPAVPRRRAGGREGRQVAIGGRGWASARLRHQRPALPVPRAGHTPRAVSGSRPAPGVTFHREDACFSRVI